MWIRNPGRFWLTIPAQRLLPSFHHETCVCLLKRLQFGFPVFQNKQKSPSRWGPWSLIPFRIPKHNWHALLQRVDDLCVYLQMWPNWERELCKAKNNPKSAKEKLEKFVLYMSCWNLGWAIPCQPVSCGLTFLLVPPPSFGIQENTQKPEFSPWKQMNSGLSPWQTNTSWFRHVVYLQTPHIQTPQMAKMGPQKARFSQKGRKHIWQNWRGREQSKMTLLFSTNPPMTVIHENDLQAVALISLILGRMQSRSLWDNKHFLSQRIFAVIHQKETRYTEFQVWTKRKNCKLVVISFLEPVLR